MKDEIKEIKIGMYTTDEILDFMTNGEGRGFMGRSMYDAILDCITNLQKEVNKLTAESTEWESKCYKYQEIINELEKLIDSYEIGKYDYQIPVFVLKDKLKELKEGK